MTPEQRAKLERLSAAIEAAPTPYNWSKRAIFWACFPDEAARVIENCTGVIGGMKAWEFGEYLIAMGARSWEFRHARPSVMERRYSQAMAASYLNVALECAGLKANGLSPQLSWELARSDDRGAAAILERARQNPGANPDFWRALAVVCAIIEGSQSGASAHAHWLRAQEERPALALELDTHASGKIPKYQRLAELDVAVAQAPDDALLRRERAQWLSWCGSKARALSDCDALVALRPDDPQNYEMRARIRWSRDRTRDTRMPLAETTERHDAILTDYLRALELRVEAGEFANEARALKTHGDALKKSSHHFDERHRAFAFYTLALRVAPDDAALYTGRAQMLAALNHKSAALSNWARALTISPHLKRPRAALLKFLVQTIKRDSAHEQIEALLEARGELEGAGLDAATASAIIAEVERALAI